MPYSHQTVGEIVRANFKSAIIFERYGIDYCCGGKQRLQDVCQKKSISLDEVSSLLDELDQQQPDILNAFQTMNTPELISYILLNHHRYIRQDMPVLIAQLRRVVHKHGDRYPWLQPALLLAEQLEQELMPHMAKEEHVLFPMLKAAYYKHASVEPNWVEELIQAMEHEHNQAGYLLEEFRYLTHGFHIPNDACTTFALCMAGWKEFEVKLHEHIHLENNILFPRSGIAA